MKNQLDKQFSEKIPEKIWEIFNLFTKNGFEIYMIGGGSRNLLMGKEITNPDFTTNATPEEIQKMLPDSFYENVFGTVGIEINGEIFEITTYRTESNYTDKRHPDIVQWGKSLEEDLSRREFTISAIAIGPDKNRALNIIDPYDGKNDLLNIRIIKAIGDPDKRFSEDALRMIRAIRIATQLKLTLEENTFSAIKKNALLINQIAKERVREELLKILSSDYPSEGITLLLTSGILEQIIPELVKEYGVTQAKHHTLDVWNHSLLSLKMCPSKDPVVRFATLLHDIGKPIVARGENENRTFYNHEVAGSTIVKQIISRLKFSKKEQEKILTLVRWHMFTVDERQTDSAIRRFIINVGKENVQDMLDLRIGDRLGGGARETSWRLEEFKKRIIEVQKQPFSIKDLKVNGKDVMEILSIQPGPKVGKILETLFKEVEEDKDKNKREYLLKKIKEI